MPYKTPDFWSLIGAIIVSIISGFVSISRRVLAGQQASVLWVTTEFMTAILAGYLMFVTYPAIESSAPKWFTLPVAVALSAHLGGRVFQESEHLFLHQFKRLTGESPSSPKTKKAPSQEKSKDQ